MKKRIILSAAIALFILAACSNDENIWNNDNARIVFSSNITATRADGAVAPDRQISAGQLVGIYVDGTVETDQINYDNVSMKAIGNGSFSDYKQEMFYPRNSNKVTISAYHPFNGATTDSYEFSVNADQSVYANYCASDLLYAAPMLNNRNAKGAKLTFKHKLANVRCVLTSEETTDVSAAKIEVLGVNTVADFNRIDGTVTATKTPVVKDVKLHSTYGAVLPLQTVAAGNFLKITLGECIYHYELKNSLTIEAAKKYLFNIDINRSAIKVTATIEAWTPNAEVDGSADHIIR